MDPKGKKDHKTPPRAKVIPLVTKRDYQLMFELLSAVLDAGGFQHEPEQLAEFEQLQEKLEERSGLTARVAQARKRA